MALTAAGLAAVGIGTGWPAAVAVLGTMVSIFFVLGKFVVLASVGRAEWTPPEGIPAAFLDPYVLAGLVTYMDVMFSVVVGYNLDALHRLPVVGPRMAGLSRNTKAILDGSPWLRKTAFLGVFLFVAFPLTGTGAVAGTILGQLIGLSRARTLLAILGGAILGSYGLAFAVVVLENRLPAVLDSPIFVLACVGILLAIFVTLGKTMFARREEVEAR